MIDNSLLAAFSSVVHEGSFEKAAQRLNVTPSAISQKVKLLESRLGSILLTRGRPCIATEIGYRLFRHVESVQLLEKDLLDTFPNNIAPTTKAPITLRIAVNADSVSTWFTAALSRFTTNHNCLFDLIIDDQNFTSDMLREGSVIAAVSADDKPIQGFRNLSLGSLRYTAVASVDFFNRFFGIEGINRNTLLLAPCITFNRKDPLQKEWLQSNFGCDTNLQSHWMPSSQGYLNACLDGLGWGLNPSLSLQKHLSDGSLIELVPGTDVDEPLYWQYSLASGEFMQELTNLIEREARRMLAQ